MLLLAESESGRQNTPMPGALAAWGFLTALDGMQSMMNLILPTISLNWISFWLLSSSVVSTAQSFSHLRLLGECCKRSSLRLINALLIDIPCQVFPHVVHLVRHAGRLRASGCVGDISFKCRASSG